MKAPLLVPTKYGDILMGVAQRNLKQHSEMLFERPFLDVIETESYDYFIDIGASWGYHCIPASFREGVKVLAFEPHDGRRGLLEQNKKNLDLDNLIIYESAVGTAKVKLFTKRSLNGMVGPKTANRGEVFTPRFITLNAIINELPRGKRLLIKIDVEGNELDVINSYPNITDRTHDIIWLIERHEKSSWGVSEESLNMAMVGYKGELVGQRKWTYHHIFRHE